MVAGLTDGCDMRCQWQLAVDDDAKVASGLGDSHARAEHQDFLARDLVEQQAAALILLVLLMFVVCTILIVVLAAVYPIRPV